MAIRVGIAGLGHMGKLHLMNALKMRPDVEVVAASDKKKSNRMVVAKNHIHVYSDYQEMMESKNLDAVIISLPNFLRGESIAYACENNLDVFVDKPLARNLAEALGISAEVKSHGIRLMVGLNYRYIDSVEKITALLEEGRIGEVRLATLDLVMNGPFSHPLVPRPVPEWWLDHQLSGGGALLDLGYHLIDISQLLFGDLKVLFSDLRYTMNLPVEDAGTIVLSANNEMTRIILNVGWFSKMIFPEFNFRINLHGTGGFLSTDNLAPKNLYKHAMKIGFLNVLRKLTLREIRYLAYTYYYASFVKVLRNFFEVIKNGDEPPVSLESQLSALKMIDSIYNSLITPRQEGLETLNG